MADVSRGGRERGRVRATGMTSPVLARRGRRGGRAGDTAGVTLTWSRERAFSVTTRSWGAYARWWRAWSASACGRETDSSYAGQGRGCDRSRANGSVSAPSAARLRMRATDTAVLTRPSCATDTAVLRRGVPCAASLCPERRPRRNAVLAPHLLLAAQPGR